MRGDPPENCLFQLCLKLFVCCCWLHETFTPIMDMAEIDYSLTRHSECCPCHPWS